MRRLTLVREVGCLIATCICRGVYLRPKPRTPQGLRGLSTVALLASKLDQLIERKAPVAHWEKTV